MVQIGHKHFPPWVSYSVDYVTRDKKKKKRKFKLIVFEFLDHITWITGSDK